MITTISLKTDSEDSALTSRMNGMRISSVIPFFLAMRQSQRKACKILHHWGVKTTSL